MHCLDFEGDTGDGFPGHNAAVYVFLGEDAARRLAACWNVCEGISTEVLELNATEGGVATLERQRDSARKERDQLMAAVEDAISTFNLPITARLAGAIAAVEGGAA